MRRLCALLVFSLLILTSVEIARAEWVNNGVPLAVAGSYSFADACVSDGAGGAIVVITDSRNGNYDVFAQRIDGLGVPQWTVNGVTISAAASDQTGAVAVSDGAGGAVIAWADTRSGAYDIYVRRVNAAGTALWTANGVALCTATGEQLNLSIASDGAGGAIVAWQDLRSGTSWDVYARRVNSTGTPQWTANGVAVCALAGLSANSPVVVADGAGGAILAWTDSRAGNADIYVQRLNASGTPQWAANGVAMCSAANTQAGARIASDGAAGAIVAWEDARSGTYDIYAQRVLSAGSMAWTANGNALCTAADAQANSSIASDGAGGAIVMWQDQRNGGDVDLFAQRVNSFGAATWDYDGVAVCATIGTQGPGTLVPDGSGGAIALWEDDRSGTGDIYAQAIGAAGVMRWQYDGMPVCTAARDQYTPLAAPDGSGGVIAAWSDDRSALFDVYAQRMEPRYGYWGRPEPTVVSAEDNPADQGGKVILRWLSSQRDRYDNPAISNYSVWRSTDFVTAAARAGTAASLVVQDPLDVPSDFAGTALWERAGANGPEYWEWIANQDAFYMASYSLTAPTRQDSVGGNPAIHYFKVVAHESDYPQTRAWESGTVSTYSVDNLAPAAPLFLTAQRAGA
ncbi:MAG: hypothetical protein OEY32_15105, partial [Candidatus Krumholzibacteria bacterium]|nr:hypothetical protein [Candidatus Krumholzibacteria bacterium]